MKEKLFFCNLFYLDRVKFDNFQLCPYLQILVLNLRISSNLQMRMSLVFTNLNERYPHLQNLVLTLVKHWNPFKIFTFDLMWNTRLLLYQLWSFWHIVRIIWSFGYFGLNLCNKMVSRSLYLKKKKWFLSISG